jgi:hypothetical protein
MDESVHVYEGTVMKLAEQIKQLQQLSSNISLANELLVDSVLDIGKRLDVQSQALQEAWTYLKLENDVIMERTPNSRSLSDFEPWFNFSD